MNAEDRAAWEADESVPSDFSTVNDAATIANLRAEVERLRAGEDPTPRPENAWPSAGQLLYELNEATPGSRLETAGNLVEAMIHEESLQHEVERLRESNRYLNRRVNRADMATDRALEHVKVLQAALDEKPYPSDLDDAEAKLRAVEDAMVSHAHITQGDLAAQRAKGWTDFHPEDYCHRCGGPNISWYTPSDVWNPVMRPEGPSSAWRWQEIICPLCFVELAGGGTWELIPAGGAFVNSKDRHEDWRLQEVARAEAAEAKLRAVEAARDALIRRYCDCGDFDGHPGDCAATPIINAFAVLDSHPTGTPEGGEGRG